MSFYNDKNNRNRTCKGDNPVKFFSTHTIFIRAVPKFPEISFCGYDRLDEESSVSAYHLRAADCKYREFSVQTKKLNFFIFGQDKRFGELFTKITIKVSKTISFSRNPAKREVPCSRRSRH